jgi:4-hydroxy-4-methyl-2-oxoglutarate aldolase
MSDKEFQLTALRAAEALDGFGAATVHEAYGRQGALAEWLKPVKSGWRICAPAFPVATTPGNNLAIHQGLYQAPRGWVLAVSTQEDRTHGYWGDILTEAARERGLCGLVLEGGVRDVRELRSLDFPIVSGSVAIRGTTKRPEGTSVGTPITLGGVDIVAGDILVADDDGVVRVRLADVPLVADAARRRDSAEERIRRDLRRGARTLELYALPEH